jgi:hypothetical protein
MASHILNAEELEAIRQLFEEDKIKLAEREAEVNKQMDLFAPYSENTYNQD